MEVIRHTAIQAEPGNKHYFTGRVELKRLISQASAKGSQLVHVRFEANARTFWHAHHSEQILIVLEGVCLLQKRGEDIVRLNVGDVARIAAKEEHWHGATKDAPMIHLAVMGNGGTDWLEEVVMT